MKMKHIMFYPQLFLMYLFQLHKFISCYPTSQSTSGIIALASNNDLLVNFQVNLFGGQYQCFHLNRTADNINPKFLSINFYSSSSHWLADFEIFFPNVNYYIGGNSQGLDFATTSLGNWPESYFYQDADHSSCYSTSNLPISSLSAGFTDVCFGNTCGWRNSGYCSDSVTYSGQLLLRGFSSPIATNGQSYLPQCTIFFPNPTLNPSTAPSLPSKNPTVKPSMYPSNKPSDPSILPTISPTLIPTNFPTKSNKITLNYRCVGKAQNFTVPVGVSIITVDMSGAEGGQSLGGGGLGGKGGKIVALVPVQENEILYIYVGCKGGDSSGTSSGLGGYNGGGRGDVFSNVGYLGSAGGGGASDIRTISANLTSRLVVSGGGGGGAYCNSFAVGGRGGGLVGEGVSYVCAQWGGCSPFYMASGGSQSTGGIAGYSCWGGSSGTLGVGGCCGQGAGGGGGYYGGGAGRVSGGGGGSNYCFPNGTILTNERGVNSGDGYVSITYTSVIIPTNSPTNLPSNPTTNPSNRPTNPTLNPTFDPSTSPSEYPIVNPTIIPTVTPTNPTNSPSAGPSLVELNIMCPTYSASNTNSASQNTVPCTFTACTGSVIKIATNCLASGCNGDVYIRLYDYNNVMVSSNDDSCGLCSELTYTIPSSTNGNRCNSYTLNQGCYSGNSCSGTFTIKTPSVVRTMVPLQIPTVMPTLSAIPTSKPIPIRIRKLCPFYTSSNTNNANTGYSICQFSACPGESMLITDCSSSAVGDQYIRLFDSFGNQVAYNDDYCGVGSTITYQPVGSTCQMYSMHEGCFSSSSCSGRFKVEVTGLSKVFESSQYYYSSVSFTDDFFINRNRTVSVSNPTLPPSFTPSSRFSSTIPTKTPSKIPSRLPTVIPAVLLNPSTIPTKLTYVPTGPSTKPSFAPIATPTLTPRHTVCGSTPFEGGSITLTCPLNSIITSIDFAGYGLPIGVCGSYSTGTCYWSGAANEISRYCLFRSSCTFIATIQYYGGIFSVDPCVGTSKSTAVQLTCSQTLAPSVAPTSSHTFLVSDKPPTSPTTIKTQTPSTIPTSKFPDSFINPSIYKSPSINPSVNNNTFISSPSVKILRKRRSSSRKRGKSRMRTRQYQLDMMFNVAF